MTNLRDREQKFVATIKEGFSEKIFIDALMDMVNSFSFNKDDLSDEILNLDEKKQNMFENAMASCIYAEANNNMVDGRNEMASNLCSQLDVKNNPMPNVGTYFLHCHPTLQQSAVSLFCNYIDKKGLYPDKVNNLKDSYGDKWYQMPLI